MARSEHAQIVAIRQGRIEMDRARLQAAVGEFEDGAALLTLERIGRQRTGPQNNFWWGVVVDRFSQFSGNNPKKAHEILKTELIGEHFLIPDMGGLVVKEVTIPGSTRKLTTVQFNELIERAQAFGSELGLYIPDPNEVSDGYGHAI